MTQIFRTHFQAALLFFGFLYVSAAHSYTVSPAVHTLYKGESTYMISVTNDASTSPVAIKIKALKRTYNRFGTETSTPTDLIKVYPSSLLIPYKKTKRFRVISKAPAEEVEKAFRIFIEEQLIETKKNSGIISKTNFNLNLYVKDKKEEAGELRFTNEMVDGELFLKATNDSNTHLLLIPEKELKSRNILAKSSVLIPIEAKISSISVKNCYSCEFKTYEVR